MTDEATTDFGFYAFISCNHRDIKWAKWIQKKLESYNLPSIVPKEIRRNAPKKLQPVFLYTEDLQTGILSEELKKNLKNSKYLIVVCSPNSARVPEAGKIHYVDEEVKYFGEVLGRKERIIPVIIDGVPDDPARECFSPAIKKFGLVGIDAVKLEGSKPWSSIRVRVLCAIAAAVLGLRVDDLIQRGVRRFRRQRRFYGALVFLAVLLSGTLGVYLWDHSRDYYEYYTDYTEQWGVPRGIFPLTEEEMLRRSRHYRFIYQGRKSLAGERVLRRVIHANFAGTPQKHDGMEHQERPMIQKLIYEEKTFRLLAVEFLDCNGKVLLRQRFSGKDFNWVDLWKDVGQQGEVFASLAARSSLDAGGLFGSANAENKSRIGRLIYERNDAGEIVKVSYHLAGTLIPVKDADGIFGRKYERNAAGQAVKTIYLDEAGNSAATRKGIAGFNSSYDPATGVLLGSDFFDSSGKSCYGDDGYAAYCNELDGNGNITVRKLFGPAGGSCIGKGGYASFQYEYDKYGNPVKVSAFDTKGNPCITREGFSVKQNGFDAQGRCISAKYFNAQQEPCLMRDGFVSETKQYDKRGNIVFQQFFGIDGKLCLQKEGFAAKKSTYDENGNLIAEAYFGTDGKPCLNKEGIASCYAEYNQSGYLISEAFGGVDGKPVENKNGCALITVKYDDRGNRIEWRFFDVQGKICLEKELKAAVLVAGYDERGLRISEKFLDTAGNPCISPLFGAAALEFQYDARGNLTAENFLGADGKFCKNKAGYASLRVKYDVSGNMIREEYFDETGEQCLSTAGFAVVERKFDRFGRRIAEVCFDTNYKRTMNNSGFSGNRLKYDVFGNVIHAAFFDTGDKPCMTAGGYSMFGMTYDARGNMSSKTFFDQQGNPCKMVKGYAEIKYQYDERDNKISTAYFDEAGKPCENKKGYAGVRYHYDERGQEINRTFFGADGSVKIFDRQGE